MTDQVLLGTLLQIFTSIDSCIERKVQLPTLMLIYAAIDGLAWLSVEDNDKVRRRFEEWIETYLFPVRAFGCSATDLYAARCGILHTFTGDSDLQDRGKATAIAYAWGDADASSLQAALDRSHPGKCVAIHIHELASSVRLATLAMFEAANSDPVLAARLRERGSRYFQPVTKTFQRGMIYSGIDPQVT